MKNNCTRIKEQEARGKWQKTISKLAFTLFVFMLPILAGAQTDSTKMPPVDMATTMRSNGKIYVVVTVLVIILLGLFFYVIRLDRKISKLEKQD